MGDIPESAPLVLLVEDEDSYRVFCRLEFQRAGFRVAVAKDGAEAIEKALAGRPDAVVLDLWLPGIPGRDVLRSLRSNPEFSNVPFVVVSGVPEVKDREGLLEDGADLVLEKPVPPPDLRERVVALLRAGRPGAAGGGRSRLERAGD